VCFQCPVNKFELLALEHELMEEQPVPEEPAAVEEPIVGDLPPVETPLGDPQGLSTRSNKIASAYSVLHRRFFHVGHQSLAEMITKQKVKDLDFPAKDLRHVDDSWFPHCAPCNLGKMTAPSHPTSHNSDADRPLWRLHGDLCMYPGSKPGRNGQQYLLSVYCEHTRYGAERSIKTKDQAGQALQECIKEMELLAPGHKVHRVRTDGGGEFVGTSIQSALKEIGVLWEETAPHTSQHHGIAERFIRRILDMVRSALVESGLPHTLWPECATAAVHTHNRIAIKGQVATPYEKLTGRVPTVGHLRVWGCPCYSHIPLELQKSKLDPRAEEGRLVGYSETNPKAWLVLVDGVVKLRTGVKCDERPVAFVKSKDGSALERRSRVLADEVIVHPMAPPLPPTAISEREQRPLRAAAAGAPLNYRFNDRVVESPGPLGIRGHTMPPTPAPVSPITDDDGDEMMSTHYDMAGMMHEFGSQGLFHANPMSYDKDDYEPVSYRDAMECRSGRRWDKAAKEELAGLEEMGTWELVPRILGQRALPSKWVFKLKRDINGDVERYKARLVVKGFRQKEGVDYNEVFAPVGSASALRVLLARAAEEDWKVHQIDFKQAFLNATLHEDVYLEIPEGYDLKDSDRSTKVLRLIKSLYGLKQAPREWYLMLKDALLRMGFEQSTADPGIFFRDEVYLLLYVDDQLIMGPDMNMIQSAIGDIAREFVITDMGPAKMFLGVEIDRKHDSITLSQKRYTLSLLKKYATYGGHTVSSPAVPHSKDESNSREMSENKDYAEIVGALLYLSTWTRPDISFAVGRLTRHMQNPRLIDYVDATRVLNYLKGTVELGITYRKGAGGLVGYTDSDYAADSTNGKSVSGMVFMMNGGPVCWKSKQQDTVATSTCEAELTASTVSAREAMWLRKLLPELGVDLQGPVLVNGDNECALNLCKHPVLSSKSKHIRQKHFYAREVSDLNEVKFSYVHTTKNLADIFTKACEPNVFIRLRDMILIPVKGK
jgi:hypothetical protein